MIIDAATVYWAVPLAAVLLFLVSMTVERHSGGASALPFTSVMLVTVAVIVMVTLMTDALEPTRRALGVIVRASTGGPMPTPAAPQSQVTP